MKELLTEASYLLLKHAPQSCLNWIEDKGDCGTCETCRVFKCVENLNNAFQQSVEKDKALTNLIKKLNGYIEEHRYNAVITCEETCWCWAADAFISYLEVLQEGEYVG